MTYKLEIPVGNNEMVKNNSRRLKSLEPIKMGLQTRVS